MICSILHLKIKYYYVLIKKVKMEIVELNGASILKSKNRLPFRENQSHISVRQLSFFQDSDYEKYYRILWVLKGVEIIHAGLDQFKAFSNLIVFVAPGKKITMVSEPEPEGWVLRLSQSFFSQIKYENLMIGNVDHLSINGTTPKIILSPKVGERVHALAGMIDELAGSQIANREKGIISLMKTILVYCESKCNLDLNKNGNHHEIDILSRFKQLVVNNFHVMHMVSDYAYRMNITPKYLNQVVKQTMGVTAKQVIQEQIILKARQELKFSNRSIKEIAFSLGFSDPFHFSNFFKESAGMSPVHYRKT
jgi:AraC family transcriptional regulator, transcriptional activator of pobA